MAMKRRLLGFTAGSTAAVLGAVGGMLAFPVFDYHSSEEVQGWIDDVQMPGAVTVATGDSDETATFGGSLPTASTNLDIPAGETLTVVAGDTFDAHKIKVKGVLIIKAPAPGFGTTSFTADTVMVCKGGKLIIDEQTGGRLDFFVRTASDINLSEDPHMITRGVVSAGEIEILGEPMQWVIPCSHSVIAGSTTRLNLTTSPFLGRNGAGGDPNDPNNYTLLDFNWTAGQRLLITGMDPRLDVADPLGGEVVEASFIQKVESVTGFSLKDTRGSYIDITAPAQKNHLKYGDAAALNYAITNFGPPVESPTHGSHGNWMGVPWIVNPNRNIKFKCTDPAAPVHRKPHFMAASSATKMRFVEFIRWGRTNILQPTVVEGTEGLTLAVDTNLRHRDALSAYDCGFCIFDGIARDGFSAEFVGVSVWDGGYYLGGAQENAAQGAGSAGMGFSQTGGSVYLEGFTAYNTYGSGIKVYYAQNTYVIKHPIVMDVWGQNPNSAPKFWKDHIDYPNGDLGRDGSCINLDARTGQVIRPAMFTPAGDCLVTLTRSPDQQSHTLPSLFMPDGPESVGMRQYMSDIVDDRPRIHLEGIYAVGTRGSGAIISKNTNLQHNGLRTHLKNFIFINCRSRGLSTEYTAQYIVDGLVDLGPLGFGGNVGSSIRLGTAVQGFTCINHFYANRLIGATDVKTTAAGAPLAIPDNRFVDFHPPMNVTLPWDGIDPETEVFTVGKENYAAPFGAVITSIVYEPSGAIRIYGRVRDPLGEYDMLFENSANESNGVWIDGPGSIGAISRFGYWTHPGGVTAPPTPYSGTDPWGYTLYPLTIENRLTPGQQTMELHAHPPLPILSSSLPTTSSNAWRHPSGKVQKFRNHGAGDYNAALAAANAALNPQGLVFA